MDIEKALDQVEIEKVHQALDELIAMMREVGLDRLDAHAGGWTVHVEFRKAQ